MTNIDNNPIFIDSTLKVTASEELDVTKELAAENTNNSTIDQLLESQNDPEEK
jgi:hypothetical protein